MPHQVCSRQSFKCEIPKDVLCRHLTSFFPQTSTSSPEFWQKGETGRAISSLWIVSHTILRRPLPCSHTPKMFYCEEHHFTLFSASHCNLNGSGPGEKNNKSQRVSGIVQGAGPNVEAGRIRPAGRSLGTTGQSGSNHSRCCGWRHFCARAWRKTVQVTLLNLKCSREGSE